MRILITGSEGMLAKDLIPCLSKKGHNVIAPPESDFNIINHSTVINVTNNYKPEIIINCAAYTAVDNAEKEEEKAIAVNGYAVNNLCLACQKADIPLVHFSTDYVFDGTKASAYTIDDKPNPIGAYGRSKLIGEQHILRLLNKFYLIRTSWLFGYHGKNFIETMLNLSNKKNKISVVNDQKGCPTWTQHLAEATSVLIETGRYGIYHITNSEPTTWYDFAKEIFTQAQIDVEVIPINSDQFPTPAKRPKNSVLDPFPPPEVLGKNMPSWKEALQGYLNQRNKI